MIHLYKNNDCIPNKTTCIHSNPWSLKIPEKVSFNNASEASYGYIFQWTKAYKKCQKPKACGQTVLPERSSKWSKNTKIQTQLFWVIFNQCAKVEEGRLQNSTWKIDPFESLKPPNWHPALRLRRRVYIFHHSLQTTTI